MDEMHISANGTYLYLLSFSIIFLGFCIKELKCKRQIRGLNVKLISRCITVNIVLCWGMFSAIRTDFKL